MPVKTQRQIEAREFSAIVKEWIAIIIAVSSLVFSAGGWYFKVTDLEKRMDSFQMDYVRKDVLGAQLESIDHRLTNMETGMQKLDVKLDSVTVAVGQQGKR